MEAAQEGKMFGVLLGKASPEHSSHLSLSPPSFSRSSDQHLHVVLVACSGQLEGVWEPRGWAPSLLDHHQVSGASWRAQRDLHRLTYRVREARRAGSAGLITTLKQERRERSRQHADELRDAVSLTPLIGDPIKLSALWPRAATGVGECCAPKLISWAAQLGVEPLGLAECQFTPTHDDVRPPRAQLVTSKSVEGGSLSFYEPCEPRCQPLLPFLLRGEREVIDLK